MILRTRQEPSSFSKWLTHSKILSPLTGLKEASLRVCSSSKPRMRSTISSVELRMSFMNSSRESSPRSICLSFCSHSPVSSAEPR